jgi:hypothetical protein
MEARQSRDVAFGPRLQLLPHDAINLLLARIRRR